MHRAEIAAYVPAGLTAVIYFAMGFYAGQWGNYSDLLAGTGVLGALGHALGQRHHAWAGIALIGYLLLVSVMRVVSEGRPLWYLLLPAYCTYLAVDTWRRVRTRRRISQPSPRRN